MNEKMASLLHVLEGYLRHPTFSGNDLATRYLKRIAEIIRDENRDEFRNEDFLRLHPRMEEIIKEETIAKKLTSLERRQLIANNVQAAISELRKHLDAVSNERGLRQIIL